MKIPGTRPYVAPEIFRYGADQLSTASDIWAIGCMGFEFCAGRLLFESEEMVESFVQTGALEPSRAALIQQNQELAYILSGCLNSDPAQRWSIWQLLDQIQRLRQQYS